MSTTYYLTSTASPVTLTTANELDTAAPAAEASFDTLVGNQTGFAELYSQGNPVGSVLSPTELPQDGQGFIWDVTTLEGKTVAAGNYTPTLKLATTVASIVADIHFRVSKRTSGNVFTTIAESTLSGSTINTTPTVYNLPAAAGPLTTFGVGDKLYVDIQVKVTTPSGNGLCKVSLYENGGLNESFLSPDSGVFIPTEDDPPGMPGSPGVQSVPWLARTFLDSAEQWPLEYFPYDQEEPDWISRQRQSVSWRAQPFLDDDVLSYLTGGDEDIPYVAQTQARPWLARPFTDDDPTSFTLVSDDDTPFVPRRQAVAWARPDVITYFDADDLLGPRVTDDDIPYVARVQSQPWISRPFLDDEIKSLLHLTDEDIAYVPQVQAQPWRSLAFYDEQPFDAVLSFTHFGDEDIPYVVQRQAQPWASVPFLGDELLSFSLVTDDDIPYVARRQNTPWLSRPFIDLEQPWAAPPNFYREQEEGSPVSSRRMSVAWTAYTAPDDGMGFPGIVPPITTPLYPGDEWNVPPL